MNDPIRKFVDEGRIAVYRYIDTHKTRLHIHGIGDDATYSEGNGPIREITRNQFDDAMAEFRLSKNHSQKEREKLIKKLMEKESE
jgi:hypothetical protein